MTISAKEAARLLNVTPSTVYKMRLIARLRPDLVPKVDAGKLSVHRAWLIAKEKQPPSSSTN